MADAEVSSADTGAAGAKKHGHVKVDNDNEGANGGTCELHGVGDRCGRRIVRMRDVWRWENLNVSSVRCTSILLLWTYSQDVLRFRSGSRGQAGG